MQDDMVNNIDVMRKGMQLAIEMQMGHLVACAKNRLYMDKLLDDVVSSLSITATVQYSTVNRN